MHMWAYATHVPVYMEARREHQTLWRCVCEHPDANVGETDALLLEEQQVPLATVPFLKPQIPYFLLRPHPGD